MYVAKYKVKAVNCSDARKYRLSGYQFKIVARIVRVKLVKTERIDFFQRDGISLKVSYGRSVRFN